MIEIFNQEKRMENFSRMKRFINSEESRFNQTYRRNIITGLNKLFYSYGDDEERAEGSAAASPEENVAGGVFGSFGKERSVVGDGEFDPAK